MKIVERQGKRNWVFIINYHDGTWDWVEFVGTAGDRMEIEDHLKYTVDVKNQWGFGTPDSDPESWWHLKTGQHIHYMPYANQYFTHNPSLFG